MDCLGDEEMLEDVMSRTYNSIHELVVWLLARTIHQRGKESVALLVTPVASYRITVEQMLEADNE